MEKRVINLNYMDNSVLLLRQLAEKQTQKFV